MHSLCHKYRSIQFRNLQRGGPMQVSLCNLHRLCGSCFKACCILSPKSISKIDYRPLFSQKRKARKFNTKFKLRIDLFLKMSGWTGFGFYTYCPYLQPTCINPILVYFYSSRTSMSSISTVLYTSKMNHLRK